MLKGQARIQGPSNTGQQVAFCGRRPVGLSPRPLGCSVPKSLKGAWVETCGSPGLLGGPPPRLLLGSLGLGKERDLSEVSQGDRGGAGSKPSLCASRSTFSFH